ncbi:ABC transporter substrate-binding protein [Dermabacteraceae bacterium TAE3-ERU27]|nr:ABC transporter substrate-binding protein [Dermabacteraceae bacterium TAE3-ERU27]
METPRTTRRTALMLAGLGLGAPLLASCGTKEEGEKKAAGDKNPAQPDGKKPILETMRVYVPGVTMAFSAPLTTFGSHGKLAGYVGRVKLDKWANPDVLKSLLINGETDLTATPSYAAANLFNKGVPIRLVSIVVWGMLYVMGPAGAEKGSFEALRGKKVAVPWPNRMPDLVFRYLMGENKMKADADITILPYQSPPEAMKALLTGEVDYAVLLEQAATVAEMKSKDTPRPLGRVVNLQEEWGKVTGGPARFPMAGLVMSSKLIDQEPKIVGAVLDELEASVNELNALSPEVIEKVAKATGVKPPIVKSVVPRLQLEAVSAQKAKPELEDFYTRLSTLNPNFIGGKLPAADFYAADPR